MDRKEGSPVDLATENALLKWKDEIISSVNRTIEKAINSMSDQMSKVFDIRMANAENNIESLKNQSSQHYEEMKKEKTENLAAHTDILDKVDMKLGALREEITGLDRRQSKDEGMSLGKKDAADLQINKKSLWVGVVSFLVPTIVSIIIFLVT